MGYIFDPQVLDEIGRMGIGREPREMVRVVCEELARRYPGHIETGNEWVYNMAAGAVGVMKILHGSLTEYLIIYGSALGTGGYSGRYRVEIHDTVMAGEMWTYTDDDVLTRVVTKVGEHACLARERVKGFCIQPGTWLLEYGRGPIPTTLPLALGDALLSCMDGYTVAATLWQYGKLTVRELLQGKI